MSERASKSEQERERSSERARDATIHYCCSRAIERARKRAREMKERDERGREKGREGGSASVHSLCIYMRKENTHAHTAGQIDIFFQHACKSQIGNLASSAKTLLRDETTKVWLYVCDEEGSGPYRAFKTEAGARKWASANPDEACDGALLGKMYGPEMSDYSGPAPCEVPGSPAKVFVVVGGDRGCTCSFVGAFDNAKEAEEHAKGCNDDDHGGLSYWTDEVDLETDGPNDFYISPEDLPKLDFPNLCKSAMVCKEWNAAVKGALVLLDTLCFSFELAK